MPASSRPPGPRKSWTAICDSTGESLRGVLSRALAQRLLGFFHIVQSQFAGVDEVGHYRLGASAEQRQQLIDQPPLGIAARDGRFENIRIADPLDASQRAFGLQPVNG